MCQSTETVINVSKKQRKETLVMFVSTSLLRVSFVMREINVYFCMLALFKRKLNLSFSNIHSKKAFLVLQYCVNSTIFDAVISSCVLTKW